MLGAAHGLAGMACALCSLAPRIPGCVAAVRAHSPAQSRGFEFLFCDAFNPLPPAPSTPPAPRAHHLQSRSQRQGRRRGLQVSPRAAAPSRGQQDTCDLLEQCSRPVLQEAAV